MRIASVAAVLSAGLASAAAGQEPASYPGLPEGVVLELVREDAEAPQTGAKYKLVASHWEGGTVYDVVDAALTGGVPGVLMENGWSLDIGDSPATALTVNTSQGDGGNDLTIRLEFYPETFDTLWGHVIILKTRLLLDGRIRNVWVDRITVVTVDAPRGRALIMLRREDSD